VSLRVFIGYDPRQPVAVQVLSHSLWERASKPVSIARLELRHMPSQRRGLTEFSFSRYCVPAICDFEGDALFMDADMLCLGDIYEMVEICKAQNAAVCVVKNPRLRFEWTSLMYFNNALCKKLTPELVTNGQPQDLSWAEKVGEIPSEWNHLVGYDAPRKDAKVVHFTQGIPCFKETTGCEYEAQWAAEINKANSTVSWAEIMGNSVHAKPVMDRLMRKAAA
jgi:hypothetical protein